MKVTRVDGSSPTTHDPIVFQRTNGSRGSNCTRTKQALAFLCLFDGLRTPSIRRLARKPRTICDNPLLSFFPSCYAPKSLQCINQKYQDSLRCPVNISVDPSVQNVMILLRKYTTSLPPQRVVLHYYGHGCLEPTGDGHIFFFSDDRQRYKPLKISHIVNSCSCPLCLILDCSKAGSLLPFLKTKLDMFSFYACDYDEYLPLSTDAPMDLFSSCLLSPFLIAIWHYNRTNSQIYNSKKVINEKSYKFLEEFLLDLLDSILFESQTALIYNTYTKDPAMASLARGFILAQVVMGTFNIHPIAQPEIKYSAKHQLWDMWEVTIDLSSTLSETETQLLVYEIYEKCFPKCGISFFSYFIKQHNTLSMASKTLLDYVDTNEWALETVSRSSIVGTIVDMNKPNENVMLILAKIIASQETNVYSQSQQAIAFSSSKDVNTLKAGMLALTCAMATNASTFNRITSLCIDHAIDCAPFSSLLLGLLIEKAGRLMNLPVFGHKFLPLLEHEREDIRASAVFLLGTTKDQLIVDDLVGCLKDRSPLVRQQALVSLVQLMRFAPKIEILDYMMSFEQDENDNVKNCALGLHDTIENVIENKPDSFHEINSSFIISILLQSVKANGFMYRYKNNVFDL